MDNLEPEIIEMDVSFIRRPRWKRLFYLPKTFSLHYKTIRKNTDVNRFYAAFVAMRLALLIMQ